MVHPNHGPEFLEGYNQNKSLLCKLIILGTGYRDRKLISTTHITSMYFPGKAYFSIMEIRETIEFNANTLKFIKHLSKSQ